MKIVSAAELEKILAFPALVEVLRKAFTQQIAAPVRHAHTMTPPEGADNFFLLMPAWHERKKLKGVRPFAGIKLVTVYPDNPASDRPTVQAQYLLIEAETGAFVAAIDGTTLTLWRTAAASALAASFLAREDASSLLMVGAGAMAPYLIRAHAAVRPIKTVKIWNRNIAKAEQLAASMDDKGLDISASNDLSDDVARADIISCATVSADPIIHGEMLNTGSHMDLVGAFRPDLRETDDDVMRRGRVFVDTHEGALDEAGDIIQALNSGALQKDEILADLHELCRGEKTGRKTAEEITVFKSVGTALEDLAAAQHVYNQIGA